MVRVVLSQPSGVHAPLLQIDAFHREKDFVGLDDAAETSGSGESEDEQEGLYDLSDADNSQDDNSAEDSELSDDSEAEGRYAQCKFRVVSTGKWGATTSPLSWW